MKTKRLELRSQFGGGNESLDALIMEMAQISPIGVAASRGDNGGCNRGSWCETGRG